MTIYDESPASDGKGGPHPLAGVSQDVLDAATRELRLALDDGQEEDVEALAHGVLIAAQRAKMTELAQYSREGWRKIRDAPDLETAIGMTVGAASMCWSNPSGAGVFDDQWAGLLVENLLEMVRDYVR